MHEIGEPIPDPLFEPAGCRLVLQVTTVMGTSVGTAAIERGLAEARAEIAAAGLSAYTAWAANAELVRDWHDAMENPDLGQDGIDHYRALATRGNAWQRAERAALLEAVRDERDDKHEYRMFVVWDSQPGPVNEDWGHFSKAAHTGPVYQWGDQAFADGGTDDQPPPI